MYCPREELERTWEAINGTLSYAACAVTGAVAVTITDIRVSSERTVTDNFALLQQSTIEAIAMRNIRLWKEADHQKLYSSIYYWSILAANRKYTPTVWEKSTGPI